MGRSRRHSEDHGVCILCDSRFYKRGMKNFSINDMCLHFKHKGNYVKKDKAE